MRGTQSISAVDRAQDAGVTHPRAFTLIELLVVIAIIALLIGILLPSLGAARLAGRAVVDLSQLRQLQAAHLMYQEDNDGAFVEPDMPHGGPSPQSLAFIWITTLSDYAGSDDLLQSPTDDSPWWSIEEGGEIDAMSLDEFRGFYESNRAVFEDATFGNEPTFEYSRWTSYGLNDLLTSLVSPFITGVPDPATGKPSRGKASFASNNLVQRPSETIQWVLMDAEGESFPTDDGFARSDHVHVFDWSPPPGLGQFFPEFAVKQALRQMELGAYDGGSGKRADTVGSRSGYAFVDGHAKAMRFGDVFVDATTNRFHPEARRPTAGGSR